MQRTILNLETGEQTVVDLTPEEIAAEAAIRAADEASKSYAESAPANTRRSPTGWTAWSRATRRR